MAGNRIGGRVWEVGRREQRRLRGIRAAYPTPGSCLAEITAGRVPHQPCPLCSVAGHGLHPMVVILVPACPLQLVVWS